MLFSTKILSQIVNVKLEDTHAFDCELSLKPEYIIHPQVSGNKFRKLKYNFEHAKFLHAESILTFGGAYSNHIAAVAAAGIECQLQTIGIIRGEEIASKIESNPTLKFAQNCGMTLKFISRDAYRSKNSESFMTQLRNEFGDFYLIPEGGTNHLAVRGCEEILTKDDSVYDYICCSVGTGGTISGLINSSYSHQKILGFPALKGDFLKEEIAKFVKKSNWELITNYHFGGYAKINLELISFMNAFKIKHHVPLDPVYTGKMMYGIYDLIKRSYFPENSKILAIHTGGLQGIEGMNFILEQKKLPLLG